MSERRRIGGFVSVVLALWLLLHVYVGQRLAQGALWWAGILLLALGPVAAFWAGRAARVPARRTVEAVGFTAMGLSSLLIVFALVGDVLHARAWLGPDGFRLGVVGSALAVLVAGAWRARRPAAVRVVDVPITGLPADLEGLRIVQLSDLHVGATLKREFVERVVNTANGLGPDLIALTGDVADGFPTGLRDEVAPLAGLRAPQIGRASCRERG